MASSEGYKTNHEELLHAAADCLEASYDKNHSNWIRDINVQCALVYAVLGLTRLLEHVALSLAERAAVTDLSVWTNPVDTSQDAG